ncbi:hypothetical protein BKK47_07560 [Rodentibacter mrazii]|uniref:Uncharacterized protein n=2 Tax=Rodentibacter mrazii TaxID=1908257 RepID=A0A1V3IEJ2_9PAST|nr:hypothetical protein BKK47_07560 [Rodentibacter mrazii]
MCISYGQWSRDNPGTAYPSMQPFMREASFEDRYKVLPMNDELGMTIHEKLLIMQKISPLLFEVFMRKYVGREKPIKIQIAMNIARDSYKRYLFAAKQSLLLMLSENQCIFLA